MHRSNIHPAAGGAGSNGVVGFANDASPAKSLFGAYGGPSPLSPTYDAQLSMNEHLARTRARELMQSYARDKQRTNDLEQQVSRMGADNDELALVATQLQRHVKDLQDQSVLHQDQHAHTVDQYEAALHNARAEVEKVSTLAAHQVSDLMAQLRLREEEAAHVQGELAKARDENSRLRRDVARANGTDDPGAMTELQKAQARSVELARRLLESERAKRAAEDALIEDRKHHHMALTTIEQLRQQLAASEGRLDTERRRREDDVAQLRRQLEQVREDYDQKEDAYKRVLMNGNGEESASDVSGHNGRGANTSSRDGAASNADMANLALLCSTLEARTQSQQEHIDFVTGQNDKLSAQLQSAIRDLQTEKSKRVEEVTKAQETIRGLKDDGTRRELIAARKDKERVVAALTDLKTLYEDSVEHFANTAARIATPSDAAIVTRTQSDINITLRNILATCQAAAQDVANASGANAANDQTQRLMEMLMAQMKGSRQGGDSSRSAVNHRTDSDGTTVEAEELFEPAGGGGRQTNTSSTAANRTSYQSLASFEHERQIEALKRALDESEHSKKVMLEERLAHERQLEEELRSQLDQLVAHTQKLQRQAVMDAEELDNARHQLQLAEANAAARLARTRRDCARSIDGLHGLLKQIETEHQALLTRRYNVAHADPNRTWDRASHDYMYGNAGGEGGVVSQAELGLSNKIQQALQQQESLLREWNGGVEQPATVGEETFEVVGDTYGLHQQEEFETVGF